MLPPEDEILIARHAFPDAQAELAGVSALFSGTQYACGWYGTRISDERGSFAVVNTKGPLADLVGDILKVRHPAADLGETSVWVYCVGAVNLDAQEYDLALSRRAFMALTGLYEDVLDVLVEVVE